MEMNSLKTYFELGEKCGTAARRHDQGTVRHWSSWKTRALALELPEYREKARKAFDEGYREGALTT